MTRLQEEVVESLGEAKHDHPTPDKWTLKRASQTAMLKSSFHRCVQEAAVVGLLQRHHPVEVVFSAKEETSSSVLSEPAPQAQLPDDEEEDELRATSQRALQVLEEHVQGSHREKARAWKSSFAMLEQLDKQEEIRRAWREHHQGPRRSTGSTKSLSPLPSPVAPRWRKRLSGMTKDKLKECIANEAANQAFERAWRLENESQHKLVVRKGCTCVYCSVNPSPYQTQEYQRLQKVSVAAFPSFVDLDHDDDDVASFGSAYIMDDSSHSKIPTYGTKSTRNIPTPPSSHHDYIQRSTSTVVRPPRSLTPPRRTAKTAKITKRWSSTPMPTTTSPVPPSPPSWVSPIANRKRINYKENMPKRREESLLTPASSPCGVSSVIVLERESLNILKQNVKTALVASLETPTSHKASLDDEFDEEQLLRDELVSLGIANA